MKAVLKDGRRTMLRLDKGEEVFDEVAKFMAAGHIEACAFWGVGSCSEIELGFYNSHLKEYRKKPYYEEFEVISLMGNGSMQDGKPALHAHGEFGRTDFTVMGGHVFRIVVNANMEIFLIGMEGKLGRAHNEDFNLNLLS